MALLLAIVICLGFWGDSTPILVIIAAVTLTLAFLLALYLARGITQPLQKLSQRCKRIGEGDFDCGVDTTATDEIGELTWEFNHMSLKLQQRLESLLSEQQKARTILFHMEEGVLITDERSEVKLVNPAAERLLQIPSDKAIGHPFVEVARDHELDELLQYCLKAQKQQTQLIEIGVGKQFLKVIATPIMDTQVVGGLVVLQDLTELRRLVGVRRELLGNVSHELRTPLACIKALVETLQEGGMEDPIASKAFLEKANAEIERMSQLVQQIGELSRIESGEITIKAEPGDIGLLIEDIAQRFQVQADRASLELIISLPPELPPVLADERQIEKVMLNLLDNAIKFSLPGGKITLSVKQDGDVLAISVADTGIGIAAEDLSHVFERFYKVDKTRSGGGMGLGLAIAKHIVQAHDGSIWAESIEGRGSTFTFTLPLAP
jgi:two-component system phosphate regulon sensor histidine kinase PhoR